jgi:hypothetical protein
MGNMKIQGMIRDFTSKTPPWPEPISFTFLLFNGRISPYNLCISVWDETKRKGRERVAADPREKEEKEREWEGVVCVKERKKEKEEKKRKRKRESKWDMCKGMGGWGKIRLSSPGQPSDDTWHKGITFLF